MTSWNIHILIKIIEGKRYDVAPEIETQLFLPSLSSPKCNILTFRENCSIVISFFFSNIFYLSLCIRQALLHFLISLTGTENKPLYFPLNPPTHHFPIQQSSACKTFFKHDCSERNAPGKEHAEPGSTPGPRHQDPKVLARKSIS